ncbi:hypothetical protein H2248_010158 [Termitomyces sp. 'cryptogamus']|nr:hypothetical protein H2248_010158 [Termitomyces sp. 'cryptogamus']
MDMDIIIKGVLSLSHLCRGNHSQSILPPPATIRGPTAPSRTRLGECVRGRLVRVSSSPLPSRSSFTAFARIFARATTHAALLTTTHSMGNNQPNIIIFRNWMLTTVYILIITPLATRASIEPILNDLAFIADPSNDLTVSIDVEYELRHLPPPPPARLPTRRRQTIH